MHSVVSFQSSNKWCAIHTTIKKKAVIFQQPFVSVCLKKKLKKNVVSDLFLYCFLQSTLLQLCFSSPTQLAKGDSGKGGKIHNVKIVWKKNHLHEPHCTRAAHPPLERHVTINVVHMPNIF